MQRNRAAEKPVEKLSRISRPATFIYKNRAAGLRRAALSDTHCGYREKQ